MNAVNTQIDVLQAVCTDVIKYMEQANERFQKLIGADPAMEKRWEIFSKDRKKETSLRELKGLFHQLGDSQMIEAEVRIR